MTGGPFCVHETAGVLTATASDCGAGGSPQTPWASTINASGYQLQDAGSLQTANGPIESKNSGDSNWRNEPTPYCPTV